jgi:hypothetical protein
LQWLDRTPTKTPKPTVDPKIAALKRTNSQLNGVLKDVKSESAKAWVRQVISVNSKMISNPNGDYTNDINAAKKQYASLSAAERGEIRDAAINNMDMSTVKYLVNVYGMK